MTERQFQFIELKWKRNPNLVLFSVLEAGEFIELFRVAKKLKQNGADNIIFFFPIQGYINLERDRELCRSEDFRWIDWRGNFSNSGYGYFPFSVLSDAVEKPAEMAATLAEKPGDAATHELIDWSRRRLKLSRWWAMSNGLARLFNAIGRRDYFVKRYLRIPGLLAMTEAAGMVTHFLTIEQRKAFYRALLRALRPALVVIGQDAVGSENAYLLHAAREAKLPSLLVPFGLGTAREIYESLWPRSEFHVGFSPFNSLLARMDKRWTHRVDGHSLIRLRGNLALALKLARLDSRHPWLPNWTPASRIAVESQAMYSYYRAMGFPQEQLEVTGAGPDDVMAEAAAKREERLSELYDSLNLPADRKLILCALPPNQFSNAPRKYDFDSYQELVAFWASRLGSMRARGYNVIIRPHPVTRLKDIAWVEDLGCKISMRDTASMVPLADLFVASVSSTIRWAIAASVPVINYDCYKYGYLDFAQSPGVLTMSNRTDFYDALNRLTQPGPYRDEVVAAQQASAAIWGSLDGNSLGRIARMADRLGALDAPGLRQSTPLAVSQV